MVVPITVSLRAKNYVLRVLCFSCFQVFLYLDLFLFPLTVRRQKGEMAIVLLVLDLQQFAFSLLSNLWCTTEEFRPLFVFFVVDSNILKK